MFSGFQSLPHVSWSEPLNTTSDNGLDAYLKLEYRKPSTHFSESNVPQKSFEPFKWLRQFGSLVIFF